MFLLTWTASCFLNGFSYIIFNVNWFSVNVVNIITAAVFFIICVFYVVFIMYVFFYSPIYFDKQFAILVKPFYITLEGNLKSQLRKNIYIYFRWNNFSILKQLQLYWLDSFILIVRLFIYKRKIVYIYKCLSYFILMLYS